ncbi:hypothetical protein [Neorhizobium galegae]|uniref:hypothetical protein n=1 Tax=Neorhizobium galegae TaxID=399 RepID=UPI00351D2B83
MGIERRCWRGFWGAGFACRASDLKDRAAQPSLWTEDDSDGDIGALNTLFGGAERMQNLVFPVTLSLDVDRVSADGREIKLGSGMSATAEVRTGERRILEYVFSPLVEVAEDAMHER